MKAEVLTRSIVAVDLDGKVYTVNEYTLKGEIRHALPDGAAVTQVSENAFQMAESGVDLRAVY